jgi:hypothetical protein
MRIFGQLTALATLLAAPLLAQPQHREDAGVLPAWVSRPAQIQPELDGI